MIDLDLFKRYNDEFDHLTGDQVLQTFARAVREGLRSTDIFGRYGGDEFVQILPHTALAGDSGPPLAWTVGHRLISPRARRSGRSRHRRS